MPFFHRYDSLSQTYTHTHTHTSRHFRDTQTDITHNQRARDTHSNTQRKRHWKTHKHIRHSALHYVDPCHNTRFNSIRRIPIEQNVTNKEKPRRNVLFFLWNHFNLFKTWKLITSLHSLLYSNENYFFNEIIQFCDV